ncbi:MAG TPA: MazG family protein [Dermatophilaceae bacterium]|nr:MazG family protein [Dermatophilaceae bacterium]
MTGRLVLLASSPRVSPGLLTRDAWHALDEAATVWARATDEPLAEAVAEAGVDVTPLPEELAAPPAAARHLVEQAKQGYAVWLVSADADPGLTDAIAAEVSRLEDPPEVEVLVGSWDAPGSRLLDVVAVMDRLRSPGGCPWDAQQTHESLVKYLVEEAHEAAEAIEGGDRQHMAEELGDVLLQVAFQSRVAQEHPSEPFDIDVVAGVLVEKLVRRHPHVFSDGDASTPEDVERNWERIKAEEKAARATKSTHAGGEGGHEGLLHGIPASLSTLLVAEKVLARWERAGNDPSALTAEEGDLGGALLGLVARARQQGESADALLRRTLRAFGQDAQTGTKGRSGR